MYLTSKGGRESFLILGVCYEDNGTILGKRSRLRAFVRKVVLRPVGHYMFGRARIYGSTIYLSGCYGNNGLPIDLSKEIWERGIEVPEELEEKFWKSGGHNTCGEEGKDFYEWGRSLL